LDFWRMKKRRKRWEEKSSKQFSSLTQTNCLETRQSQHNVITHICKAQINSPRQLGFIQTALYAYKYKTSIDERGKLNTRESLSDY
jgi:hypothetical protein